MEQNERRTGRLGPRLGLRAKAAIAMALFLLCCAALVAVYLAGLSAGSRQAQPEPEPPPVLTGRVLEERLQAVQQLVSVEYFYTNMGSFENQKDFHGWKVPFTTKRFIVSYDGVIKAGVDLAQAKARVRGNTVTVTLPGAAILSHEIPEDSIQVFDESSNVFNPIRIQDYTGFTKEEKAAVEKRAVESGLLDTAGEKARTAVKAFLGLLPELEGYTLTVE